MAKIVFDFPDESLEGLKTFVASHGRLVPNPVSGNLEFVAEFACWRCYLAHVLSEQIRVANESHPKESSESAQLLIQKQEIEKKIKARFKPAIDWTEQKAEEKVEEKIGKKADEKEIENGEEGGRG